MKLQPALTLATFAVILSAPALAEKHTLPTGENEQVQHHEPAAGDGWTEPKTGMEFVWVPTGCFQMGGEYDNDEKPIHNVCIKGFWMGKYEVTQAQYEQVTGNNPSHFRGANNPVEMVSWLDAKAMAEQMSRSTGTEVRLPSEAQWEYACRAGGVHVKYCGDSAPFLLAWYGENYKKTGSTHPVGQKEANAWGLYDMSGNVWEWVEDAYHDSYEGAPVDGSAWDGGDRRVMRGGAWYYVSFILRAASRASNNRAAWKDRYGFRLARTLP